jgi:hypothetical protein
MDAVPVTEVPGPAGETLQDHRGVIVGRIEHQTLTAKPLARDARGVMLGSFDGRETRDARGRVIGRGNLLGAFLFVQGR